MLLLDIYLRSFVSVISDKSGQNLLEVCSRLLFSSFYKLECAGSGSWIRVAVYPILRLTRVPAAGYELQLIFILRLIRVLKAEHVLRLIRVPASGHKLRLILSSDPSYHLLSSVVDSSSGDWIRFAADLYFNISSKIKDLFCKIHRFMVCFLTADFSYH